MKTNPKIDSLNGISVKTKQVLTKQYFEIYIGIYNPITANPVQFRSYNLYTKSVSGNFSSEYFIENKLS